MKQCRFLCVIFFSILAYGGIIAIEYLSWGEVDTLVAQQAEELETISEEYNNALELQGLRNMLAI